MKNVCNALCRFLAQRLEQLDNNKSKLFAEFDELRKREKLVKIDKRTLLKVCDGQDAQLTMEQLLALDRYMQVQGQPGLLQVPLFYTDDNLLQSFLPRGPVMCLLGSRPIAARGGGYFSQGISANDVRAMANLLEASPLRNRSFRPADFVATENVTAELSDHEYDEKLPRNGEGAVIALGSPRANRGSEVLATRMMGLRPYEKPRIDRELPVRFVYGKRTGTSAPDSALFISPDEARKIVRGDDAALFDSFDTRRQRATIIGDDKVYISDDGKPQEGCCYGVLLAQHLSNRDVGMCVWGTSSPATTGLANLVADPERGIKRRLPDYDNTLKLQPILVALVRAEVELLETGEGQSDRRHVRRPEFVGEPRLFYAHDEQWVEQR